MPILKYFALLSQTDTDAPTLDVKENTLGGAITSSRLAEGKYRFTLPYNVSPSRIAIGVWQSADTNADGRTVFSVQMSGSGNWFDITATFGGSDCDGQLSNTPLEIRVFP